MYKITTNFSIRDEHRISVVIKFDSVYILKKTRCYQSLKFMNYVWHEVFRIELCDFDRQDIGDLLFFTQKTY